MLYKKEIHLLMIIKPVDICIACKDILSDNVWINELCFFFNDNEILRNYYNKTALGVGLILSYEYVLACTVKSLNI